MPAPATAVVRADSVLAVRLDEVRPRRDRPFRGETGLAVISESQRVHWPPPMRPLVLTRVSVWPIPGHSSGRSTVPGVYAAQPALPLEPRMDRGPKRGPISATFLPMRVAAAILVLACTGWAQFKSTAPLVVALTTSAQSL